MRRRKKYENLITAATKILMLRFCTEEVSVMLFNYCNSEVSLGGSV
jgi:hypothetical protein